MFGLVKENSVWRIRKRIELMDLYREPIVFLEIRNDNLRWLGRGKNTRRNSFEESV
jgi:hypothetical protein